MPRLLFILLLSLATATVGAAPDLTTPPFQEIRTSWLQEKDALHSARSRAYREMLEARITQAETECQETMATRNVKGLSVARKAKQISEEALASVQTNGTFTVPDSVRRELAEWIRKLNNDKLEADRQADASLAALRSRVKGRFAQVLARQSGGPPPVEPELDTLLDTLLNAEPKKPDPPPVKIDKPGPVDKPDPDTPWFAASGEGQNWVTAGRWTCDVMAQDIFSIPVLNVATSYTATKSHPFNGLSSSFTYTVLQQLKPDPAVDYVFRLKRLPGRRTVTLFAWPSPSNKGRLEFRTQQAEQIPSPHGFELEASASAAKKPSGPASIDVRIETEPAGAEIRLNGKRIANAEGDPVLTPARLRIPPGAHTLGLSLDDYVAKTFDKWSPQNSPHVAWKLQHESTLPPNKSLRLDPADSWIAAELKARIGDRVWIVPTGKWTIGARGELCGPEGYAEPARFNHYYGTGPDPRQLTNAPYGALLVRFGYNAQPIAVTNTMRLQVPATGSLFFDVNEKTDKKFRKDNRGLMGISIIILPYTP
ncbi:MAG: PEGA domain-containing protein [Kiritimatiellia bacterium]